MSNYVTFSGSHVLIIHNLSLVKLFFLSITLTSRGEVPLRLCASAQWGQDLRGPHTRSRQSRPPWPPGSPAFVPTQVALGRETGTQTRQADSADRQHRCGCTKSYCSKIRNSPYTTSSAGSLSLSPTIFVPTQTYMPASLFLVWEIISFPPRIWKTALWQLERLVFRVPWVKTADRCS